MVASLAAPENETVSLPTPECDAPHNWQSTGGHCHAVVLGGVFSVLLVLGCVGSFLEAKELMSASPDSLERRLEGPVSLLLIGGLQLFIPLGCCCFYIIMLFLYFYLYIKPVPERYLPNNAIIPADLQGRWNFGIFDCFGDCGTCLCFLFCSPCAIGDLWYRAGWVHQTLGGQSFGIKMPGWEWFAAVLSNVFLASWAGCCMPCFYAVLRGGVGFIDGSDDEGMQIKPLRKMFGIPHTGWGTYFEDCCCYCWCGACVATQEYRQVMQVFAHGPVQVAAPNAAMVGQAVIAGQPVTGPPVMATPVLATAVAAQDKE